MTAKPEYSFIYSAVRTPIGKFNGVFSSLSAPDLAAVAVRESIRRSGVSQEAVEEVILGNVVSAGIGQAPARQAALRAGLPESVGATVVNKVCGSGLKAVMFADQAVRLGQADFVVAGGMENMSQAPHLIPHMRRGKKLGNSHVIDSMIHDGLWDPHEDQHMGELCERVAKRFCYSRDNQDGYAISSYTRARRAQEKGIFAHEIVGVTVSSKNGSTLIEQDEQPPSEDLGSFPLLSPVFVEEGGTITKGNGAKINDGAAALIIGRETSGLTPLARIVGYASHAQSPETFALAPVEAIRKVLDRCGLKIDDIDCFEINEAFAVMSLAVNDLLDLNPERVNIHGGSIALGHPIGATGARILVTLLNAMTQKNFKRGVASLCIGGGEAIALVVEKA